MDRSVRAEIRYAAVCVSAGSVLLGIVLWLFDRMDVPMLLGIVLGASAAILNYFLLAITISVALDKRSSRKAQLMTGLSYVLRMVMLGGILYMAIASPKIDALGTAIPLLFPNFAIIIRAIFRKEGYSWKDRKLSS